MMAMMAMMWNMLLVVVLVGGCVSCKRAPREAVTATAPASGAQQSEGGERDKLVCRKERVIGSHMRKEVCRYQQDRRRERQAAGDQLRQGGVNAPPSPE